MNSEQKKIILVVALLVVAAVVYWRYGRTPEALPDSVEFVCVATGKVYRISRADMPNHFPARNPQTGEMTLLPIMEMDGKTVVNPRHAGPLRDPQRLEKVNKYVDPQTLEVLKSPRS